MEEAIYATVLGEGRLNGSDFRGSRVVVQEKTVDPRQEAWWNPDPLGENKPFNMRARLPEADAATVEDFARQNATTTSLTALARRIPALTIMAASDFERIFKKGGRGWDGFYDAFPSATGLVQLSRVGFNAQGSQAVVYVGRTSHYLAGAGYLVLLSKSESGWQITRRVLVWES